MLVDNLTRRLITSGFFSAACIAFCRKETFYHELTHAGHYVALGDTWYKPFVTAEENEINITAFIDPTAAPYGRGTDQTNSPIIALGESWAYHMGEYLADKRYGVSSSFYGEQLRNIPKWLYYGFE